MKTILLADDNRHIREFCRQELEDEGYRVVLARDGEEAIRLFQEQHPDIVVLDLCMPRGGGMETVEQLRAMDSSVPVIFFTAQEADCRRDKRSQLAAACMEKSEDLQELKWTISQCLTATCSTQERSLRHVGTQSEGR